MSLSHQILFVCRISSRPLLRWWWLLWAGQGLWRMWDSQCEWNFLKWIFSTILSPPSVLMKYYLIFQNELFSPKSPFLVEPIWRRFWNSYIMWNGLSIFLLLAKLKWTFLQNLQKLKCQSPKVYFKTLTFWTCFYLISPSLLVDHPSTRYMCMQ